MDGTNNNGKSVDIIRKAFERMNGEETNHIAEALKHIIEKLEKHKRRTTKISRTCSNCKFRRGIRGYDQQLGTHLIIKNWCSKSLDLMYAFNRTGNYEHFCKECEFFEEGSEAITYEINVYDTIL